MSKDERRPRDVNALAARIVAEATGQAEKTEAPVGARSDDAVRDAATPTPR